MATIAFSSLGSLQNVRNILVFPFEDAELVTKLRQVYPAAHIDLVEKKGLSGPNLLSTISTFRKRSFDLALSSLCSATIKRSLTAVQILLSLAKGSCYGIRVNKQEVVLDSKLSLLIKYSPRLAAGILAGILVISQTLLYIFWTKLRRTKNNTAAGRQARETVLFLRTDLSGSAQSGGSVSHIKGVIGAFLRKGFAVHYLADERLAALPPEVRQIQVRPWGVLDFFDELQLLGYNLQLLRQRKSIHRDIRPTLIYQRHSAFNFSGGILGQALSIPCILEANASEVWVRKHWSRLLFHWLARQCEATAFMMAQCITVVSEGVRNQLTGYKLPEGKILISPNGVDPDEFDPDVDGSKIRTTLGLTRGLVVGFIGTFWQWHGVEVLFEAATLALRKNKRMQFLLIGDGALKAPLEERAKREHLDDRIIFTGLIRHADAPAYLAACDILVSPHVGFENGQEFFGSPTKLFEYMAMGKPVIASNLGQINHIIRNASNGLLVPPGDAKQLSETLLFLSSRPRLMTRLGKQARRDVLRNHAWTKMVDEILIRLP